MAGPLPEYRQPPIAEVAISVAFNALGQWQSPYGGLYWAKIKPRYPKTEVRPYSPSRFENFDESPPARTFQFQLFSGPENARYVFRTEPPTDVIQLQRDRFIINWKRQTDDVAYPRYRETLRPRFEREWEEFKQFLSEQGLSVPEVRQCNVTYTNRIPVNDGRMSLADCVSSLFSPWWKNGSDGFLPRPETFSAQATFRITDAPGRLHISVNHLKRREDEFQIIEFKLGTRGLPSSSSTADILRSMDIGHEWIVRGFTDLTSPSAHKLWGRIQ